ncbi:hypothetical protein CDD83_8206 [Cordyceps sp. RAO-2017]|nr:hypothetical protein CDD83_8206 [Cordyceps sp. RAO-2017]
MSTALKPPLYIRISLVTHSARYAHHELQEHDMECFVLRNCLQPDTSGGRVHKTAEAGLTSFARGSRFEIYSSQPPTILGMVLLQSTRSLEEDQGLHGSSNDILTPSTAYKTGQEKRRDKVQGLWDLAAAQAPVGLFLGVKKVSETRPDSSPPCAHPALPPFLYIARRVSIDCSIRVDPKRDFAVIGARIGITTVSRRARPSALGRPVLLDVEERNQAS